VRDVERVPRTADRVGAEGGTCQCHCRLVEERRVGAGAMVRGIRRVNADTIGRGW
jgi:hypothetical protein